MDHLKFNCYDLATHNTELHNYYRLLQQLSEELTTIINSLDPQIASYMDLLKRFSTSQTMMSDIVARLLTAHRSMDLIIDIYYSAEHRVLETVEDLPIRISANGREPVTNPIPVTPSTINSSDLILENWILERIIKDSRYENNGRVINTDAGE